MKKILFVHQSAELYGSDKTLLLLLKYLDKNKFFPIVVLPNEGPLKTALESEKIEVVIAPIIKLHRKMFVPKNLFLILNQVRMGFLLLNKLYKEHHFEIVYSNTLAVLLGYLFAKKNRIKHIWHVHEIIESPKIVNRIFRFLLARKSNSFTIYNSRATANFWESTFEKRDNFNIVSNGLEVPTENISINKIIEVRKNLFEVNEEIVIGLVGRINKWKGQFILIEAFYNLTKKYTKLKLIFVGSTTENQLYILKELTSKIKEYNIENFVKIIPFQSNINQVWHSIDIAIVPSIEPEPFGLVALEAMLARKPVIASNHGGLTEIVKHNSTGLLVEPNNVEELIKAIEILVNDENLRLEMGKKGYIRAIEEFSIQKYVSKIEKVLAD
jgi:glycosyltransferase involved in cell wall biosynthesis